MKPFEIVHEHRILRFTDYPAESSTTFVELVSHHGIPLLATIDVICIDKVETEAAAKALAERAGLVCLTPAELVHTRYTAQIAIIYLYCISNFHTLNT
jgi:hypothetical protein